MEVPQFPEHQHPLIKPLAYYSDSDLLALFQRQPGRSRYFVTLFCRYSTLVYALVQHLVRSPKQADYLFASAWRDIFYQLPHLPLPNEAEQDPRSLQHWIINRAVVSLNQMEVPPSPQITYSLAVATPPLWCYVQTALDQLPGDLRLLLVLSQTFHWPEAKILGYFQTAGYPLSSQELREHLRIGYAQLATVLPQDIWTIYGDRLAQDSGDPAPETLASSLN